MSRRALIIQHIAVETLGANFSAVLGEAGFELVPLAAYAGADDRVRFAAPDLADVDLIVSLGGPQSANDPVPALRREMAYLRAAATGKPQVPVVGCASARNCCRARWAARWRPPAAISSDCARST